jgi:hypothetical protein
MRNGASKTTTMRILLILLRPTSGRGRRRADEVNVPMVLFLDEPTHDRCLAAATVALCRGVR